MQINTNTLRKASILVLILSWIFALHTSARASLSSMGAPQLRDPLGETAAYSLTKNKARTSSMVRSGKGSSEVTQFLPGDTTTTGLYQVKFKFDVSIFLLGRKSETQLMQISSEYFQPSFMEKLRRDKQFQTEEFKVRYLGKEDTKTLEGKLYPQCDKILIYDIKLVENSPVAQLIKEVAEAEALHFQDEQFIRDDMKDLTITALVKEGIPVLGAVKIDLKGRVSGRAIKLGFDYKSRP